MEIRKEINGFYELADMVWSGAVDTITYIQNANKENEFMDLIENVFCNELPTDTEINDFIWFERDFIYENIGLTEDGNLPEDEMEESLNESIESLEDEEEFDDFCDCNDCDTCVFNNICSTVDDCKALFEDYKNQVITIDEIKGKIEEKIDMNIWR